MRDVEQQQAWAKAQVKNPSQSWANQCQSFSRQSYGMPAYGGSAKIAWGNINSKFKTLCDDPRDKEWWASVPVGAILYSTAGTYGHAWLAAGDMTAWSNDYKRHAQIDRVPIDIPAWSSVKAATQGYVIGTQWYEGDGFFKGLTTGLWDGKVPPYENVKKADEDRTLASAAAWRLACRLHDLGFGGEKWTPVKYVQTYPVKAMAEYNAKYEGMEDPTVYGPKAHERIFHE